jgi:hypothetical protein
LAGLSFSFFADLFLPVAIRLGGPVRAGRAKLVFFFFFIRSFVRSFFHPFAPQKQKWTKNKWHTADLFSTELPNAQQ